MNSRAVVRAHASELGLCYERAARRTSAGALSLNLALEITPRGFVGPRARLVGSGEVPFDLGRCVELAAERWRFPPVAGAELDLVLVSLSFRAVVEPPR